MWFCYWVHPKRPHTNGDYNSHYIPLYFALTGHVGLFHISTLPLRSNTICTKATVPLITSPGRTPCTTKGLSMLVGIFDPLALIPC